MQLSGIGGKRAADPAVHARQRLRLAVHRMLQPVWLLRSRMANVADAIVYHLQADVVEAAYSQFCADAAAASEYSQLLRVTEEYLQRLRAGAFFGQPSVHACIGRLLGRCEELVALVDTHAAELGALLEPEKQRPALVQLTAAFQADTRRLIGLLRGSRQVVEATSLLTRLNFSGFFSDE